MAVLITKDNEMNYLVTILFLVVLSLFTSAYAGLGTQEVSFLSKSSKRTLTAEVYYPLPGTNDSPKVTQGIWLRTKFSKIAPDLSSPKTYPLVVFSHGFQGDRLGNSWLAEHLVAKGYVVAMIDHTFNTSYDHNNLFSYTSLWQRPTDMSELISYLLDHPMWGKLINKDQIAVAGFSLGGTTALWLGGIRASKDTFKSALDKRYASWSTWPNHDRAKARSVDWTLAEKSYYDARIKAVIAMAPDLGNAFSSEGLKEMKVPTLLLIGDKDTITPKCPHALVYAKGIPQAELVTFKDVGHFIFMNKCSPLGHQETPYLCTHENQKEPIHTQAAAKIDSFLKSKLRL